MIIPYRNSHYNDSQFLVQFTGTAEVGSIRSTITFFGGFTSVCIFTVTGVYLLSASAAQCTSKQMHVFEGEAEAKDLYQVSRKH
jgi:hypothetical protein